MAEIIDFYQYKYSRSNYYLNLALTKDKIINIKNSIEDGFEDLFINKNMNTHIKDYTYYSKMH